MLSNLSDFFYIRLVYNTRFTVARWLFVFVGIISLIFIDQFISPEDLPSPIDIGPTMLFFFIVAVLNIVLFWLVSGLEKDPAPWLNNTLAVIQVVFDLFIVSVLFFLLGGREDVISVLYFIPVIEAVILFNFIGATFFSLLAGFLLNIISFLKPNFNSLNDILNGQLYYLSLEGNQFLLSTTISFAFVYLILSSFLSYHFEPIKAGRVSRSVSALMNKKTNKAKNKEHGIKEHPEHLKMTREIEARNLEVKLLQEDLSELDAAKAKFISVTAHQLRTPLAAIKWTFNMLLDDDSSLNEEEKALVQRGSQSVQKMIGIVNNLLHVDSIDSKQSDYNMSQVNLVDIIEKIVNEFTNQTQGKKIKLAFNKPDKDLPLITADPTKLVIVIENLVDNAVKYTPVGGSVTISLSDDKINSAEPKMEILVSDTGIGIPKDQQEKMFGKFYRATNAVLFQPDGSGIGLYISKDIAEKHNGSLWFESKEGQGTTFHLLLPINQKNNER